MVGGSQSSSPSSSIPNLVDNKGFPSVYGFQDFPPLGSSNQSKKVSETLNSEDVNQGKIDGNSSFNLGSSKGSESFLQIVSSIGVNHSSDSNPNPISTKTSALESKMKLKPLAEVNGKLMVSASSKDFSETIEDCENLVVGFFVGKRLSFSSVTKAVSEFWQPKGEVSIKLHGDCAFIFEFSNDVDRTRALELGSFEIAKRLFTIRPWKYLLEKSISDIKTVPIWILIFGVPLHMWNIDGLSMIASFIGTPLLADDYTLKKTRLAYARVCVEIGVDFKYPKTIPLLIDGRIAMELPVEYQWKPPKCESCNVFGHITKTCTKTRIHNWIPKTHKVQEKSQLSASTKEKITSSNDNIADLVSFGTPCESGNGCTIGEAMEGRPNVNAAEGNTTLVSGDDSDLLLRTFDTDVQQATSHVLVGKMFPPPPPPPPSVAVEWTYARKNKRSSKIEDKQVKNVSICVNSFEILAANSVDSEVDSGHFITEQFNEEPPHEINQHKKDQVDCIENSGVSPLAKMDLSRVTIRKKKKKKKSMGKDLDVTSIPSKQLFQDQSPFSEVNLASVPAVEAKINDQIDSQIAFNKILGISDHPMMRSMCRDMFVRNANPRSDMEMLSNDDDGLGEFDPDSDYDEKIEVVRCSSEDENEDFGE